MVYFNSWQCRIAPPVFVAFSQPLLNKASICKTKICRPLKYSWKKINISVQRTVPISCSAEINDNFGEQTTNSQTHQRDLLETITGCIKKIGLVTIIVGLTLFNNTTLQASQSHYLDQAQITLAAQWQQNLNGYAKKLDTQVDILVGGMVDLIPASDQSPDIEQKGRQLIEEVYEVVLENYMSPRDEKFNLNQWAQLKNEAQSQKFKNMESVYRAVKVMLSAGLNDPYSRFISPPEFEEMRKYDMSGVGLNLGTGDEMSKRTGLPNGGVREGVWVVGVIKGAQGWNAGISQGDQILQVNGEQIHSQSPYEIATMMSDDSTANPISNVSKEINVVIRKNGSGETQTVNIERPKNVVAQSPVTFSLQKFSKGRKVGIIRLSSFNAIAQQEVSSAIKTLKQQGAQEFILDLRDNRGGLVQEGIEVAKLFLPENAVVVRTTGPNREATYKSSEAALTEAPLSLLVNGSTASASEILAGALHDNCRAVLAGSTTYGKGVIQSVYELSDTSGLAITVGKYITPGGTDIDRTGIQPDFKNIPSTQKAEEKLKLCRVQQFENVQEVS
eukprot:TRINITY_DN20447_c0_g1_i1.p1 TRINITY_DN20447_c0_g1~~TRINITY_DN20447_c0_g1_i1.p1  ORF type:complete len:559 (-),score=95.65 TRINITY_DN20447_c0_g1_i1:197-1873(-)